MEKNLTIENQNTFKSSYELTIEEIQALPKVPCQINKIVTNKGKIYFQIKVKFIGDGYEYKKEITIKEAEYNHFVRKHRLDPSKGTYVVELPVRFIKGINTLKKEYHILQIFLSEKCTITEFLKTFDINELVDIGYKIDFVERDDVADVELEVEF